MPINRSERNLILHSSKKCNCGEPMARDILMDDTTGYWACRKALLNIHGTRAPFPSPRIPFLKDSPALKKALAETKKPVKAKVKVKPKAKVKANARKKVK